MLYSNYLGCCQYLALFRLFPVYCLYIHSITTLCSICISILSLPLLAPPIIGNYSAVAGNVSASTDGVVRSSWPIFAPVRLCHLVVAYARRGILHPASYIGVGGVGDILAVSTFKLHPPETLGGAAFFTGIRMPNLSLPNYLGGHANLETPSDER